MKCDIIIGGQWGDEGKAKMIDYKALDYDIIVRYQGGSNAGHTVKANGKSYIFHLIPSGILHKDKICVLGNGVVIDINTIIEEIEALEKEKINIRDRLKISKRAFCVLSIHKELDTLRESLRVEKIGTTSRGIGPAYIDKISRIGIPIGMMKDKNFLRKIIVENLREKNILFEHLYCTKKIPKVEKIIKECESFYEKIKNFLVDTVYFLNESIKQNKKILFEGAQGTGLDINFGTYPYVTSSSCISGGASIGSGVGIRNYQDVIGVFKAYTTRVGMGPMPSLIVPEKEEAKIRELGQEFGATTGRPRRCGWFDAVHAKYSVLVNSISHIALTKLDVLNDYEKIKLCYTYEIDGKLTDKVPSSIEELERAIPRYVELDGWQCPLENLKTKYDLPKNTRLYLSYIEDIVKTPITYLSFGPSREETLVLG